MDNVASTRALAFYLPAFHPIPENDEQWGKGFTEWHNVAFARPRFRGQYQPHVPADLGYYDLRLAETRQAQAELARRFGVHGFVYYHYWFHGKQLLQRPFEDVLTSGEPDFPFALCWANESWTRRWDGGVSEVFVPQTYSDADDARHFDALLPALSDHRYIRVDGKPLLLIYRASQLPAPRKTLEGWRSRAEAAGLAGLYLCRVEAEGDQGDPRPLGFDAAVEFQPDFAVFWRRRSFVRRALRRFLRGVHPARVQRDRYQDYVDAVLAQPVPSYPRYPGACPSWDNSPRRRYAPVALVGCRPELFEEWVVRSVLRCRDPQLLFINGWNEWGEGCHLEPDQATGQAWLEALRKALTRLACVPTDCRSGVVITP